MSENSSDSEKAIYKIDINAPIEKVWNELVKTDQALPFFFGAVCKTRNGLETGQPMAMRTPNGKYTSVVGKVLEFNPPFKYSHTLKFTQFDDAPVTICYELKEIESGTEFTLTTIGAIPGSKTSKSMAQGGPFIVNTLKHMVETGSPNFGGKCLLTIISLMQGFTPKVCRSENWSFEKIEELEE
jgi:uncharacterized protein YndB with AHSA1/START domain